ncbi:MAG: hypothetical protein GY913_18565 [Proteobacteria bacterium]|nr:hypothetical protein [Pseudomonadota bacterium]MCP4918914.1 hypothetical protein [Pseudomonadota bacterium]
MRLVADLLSALNLSSGVAAIVAIVHGRPDIALACLAAGATFDALDGLAARRFGSTPWGHLSDDVADFVTNGLAPGAALAYAVGGRGGLAMGLLFATFTLARLVFFTLNKGEDDDVFRGVPSTAGAALVLSAAVLLPASWMAFVAGAACVLMVAFDSRYRHVGRALAASAGLRRRALVGFLTLVAAGLFIGPQLAAGAVLALVAAYAFWPQAQAFTAALRRRGERPA